MSTSFSSDPRPGTRELEQTVLGALGIMLQSATDQAVVASMPIRSDDWTIGRGVLAVLAETCASLGAGLTDPAQLRAFGVSLELQHLLRTFSGVVQARALRVSYDEPAKLQVWNIEMRSSQGHMVAVSRCTLALRQIGQ